MCWSMPASAVLGVAGVAAAGYAYKKGESKFITIPLLYFSLMEFLQFFSFFYLDQCSLSANHALTIASYAHMALQPLFLNMFIFYGMSKPPPLKVRRIVYAVCLVFTGLALAKLIPLVPSALCTIGQTICGPNMCTVSGSWHLGWSVPYYNWPLPWDAFLYYAIPAFIVPLFYGAWRSVLIIVLIGPVLAYPLSGGNPLEWPAIWCLYSIAAILYAFATILHKKGKLRVRGWRK